MESTHRRGVYPGSFDPPTIAHVAIAEAALLQAGLDRLDFAISRIALGKEERTDFERSAPRSSAWSPVAPSWA